MVTRTQNKKMAIPLPWTKVEEEENEKSKSGDSTSSEETEVTLTVDDKKQKGRLFSSSLGKRNRRQSVEKSEDVLSEVNSVWTTQVSRESISSARENEESVGTDMDNKQIHSKCDDQDKHRGTVLPFKRIRRPPQKLDKDFLW
jgi:hypothetical protein